MSLRADHVDVLTTSWGDTVEVVTDAAGDGVVVRTWDVDTGTTAGARLDADEAEALASLLIDQASLCRAAATNPQPAEGDRS